MHLVIARLGPVCLFWALATVMSPQALAQMSQEELRTFEELKAKAIKGDSQAESIVASAYLSGKAFPDDKAEALAFCLNSLPSKVSVQELFKHDGFRKMWKGMSDEMITEGITKSFRLREAKTNNQKLGLGCEPPKALTEIEVWQTYGNQNLLCDMVSRAEAKDQIKLHRERSATESSPSSIFALARAVAASEPVFSDKHMAAKTESRKLYHEALKMTRDRPAEATLRDMYEVAEAYSKGTEVISADRDESRKWVERIRASVIEDGDEFELRDLINSYEYGLHGFPADKVEVDKLRMAFVARLRESAESGSLSDWRRLAFFLSENPHFIDHAGGKGLGGSIWSERCLAFNLLKIEAGDASAIDDLIAAGGYRAGSPEEMASSRAEYFKLLNARFMKLKRPDDALALARLYRDGQTYGMDSEIGRSGHSQASYAEALFGFYFKHVAKRASAGSSKDKFMLALLKDDVSAEGLNFYGDRHLNEVTSEALELKKIGLANLIQTWELWDPSANPFGGGSLDQFAGSLTMSTSRELYLDFLKAFDRQDFSKNGVFFEIKRDVATDEKSWTTYYQPPNFDYFEAKKWALSRLAAMDDEVASSYAKASGSPKDETLALRWRLELVKLGDRRSIAELSQRYDQGSGVPVDKVKSYAFSVLSLDTWAFAMAPSMKPVEESIVMRSKLSADDIIKAEKIISEFIKKFYEDMAVIAQQAYNGYAAEKKHQNEIEIGLYRKIAERGEAGAQANLGVALRGAQGESRNLVDAANWLQKAADQGNSYAQYNLGLCYFSGEGVGKDEIEAYAYWKIAGKTGYDARRKLSDIEKRMTPEALLRGQQRAKEIQKEIEGKIAARRPGK
jgi:TPR repeat protein